MEIWKDIIGYEGYYKVSNKGNVKSLNYNGTKKERNLKITSFDKDGYVKITLTVKRKAKHFRAHRLVAIAFIPNPENKPEVNHIDGNKANNNDWNLEWNTESENQKHATDTGLRKTLKGEEIGNSKLVATQVLEIREKGPYKTLAEIGKDYGVGPMQISRILNRQRWQHI